MPSIEASQDCAWALCGRKTSVPVQKIEENVNTLQFAKRKRCCCTFRRVLESADVLLTVFKVVCKDCCFLKHRAVASIACRHERFLIQMPALFHLLRDPQM